jgi:hypothetical protein
MPTMKTAQPDSIIWISHDTTGRRIRYSSPTNVSPSSSESFQRNRYGWHHTTWKTRHNSGSCIAQNQTQPTPLLAILVSAFHIQPEKPVSVLPNNQIELRTTLCSSTVAGIMLVRIVMNYPIFNMRALGPNIYTNKDSIYETEYIKDTCIDI